MEYYGNLNEEKFEDLLGEIVITIEYHAGNVKKLHQYFDSIILILKSFHSEISKFYQFAERLVKLQLLNETFFTHIENLELEVADFFSTFRDSFEANQSILGSFFLASPRNTQEDSFNIKKCLKKLQKSIESYKKLSHELLQRYLKQSLAYSVSFFGILGNSDESVKLAAKHDRAIVSLSKITTMFQYILNNSPTSKKMEIALEKIQANPLFNLLAGFKKRKSMISKLLVHLIKLIDKNRSQGSPILSKKSSSLETIKSRIKINMTHFTIPAYKSCSRKSLSESIQLNIGGIFSLSPSSSLKTAYNKKENKQQFNRQLNL